jgi:hypothetical protein
LTSRAGLDVSRRTSLPSRLIVNTSNCRSMRALAKAIREPSGDQLGSPSYAEDVVMRRNPEPSGRTA